MTRRCSNDGVRLVMMVVVMSVWCRCGQAASCPQLKLMNNFVTNKYLGVWYEVQAQPTVFQSIKACQKGTYTMEGPDAVRVDATGFGADGAATSTTSLLKIVDPANPAHMVTDFVPGVSPPFDILDTDYNNYSCAHSCLSVVGIKTEFVYVYARNRTLEKKYIDLCRDLFLKYKLDISSLVDSKQTDCDNHVHDL